MSKVAIISDTHLGARNDSQHVLDHTVSFFSDVFFPEIRRRGVSTIVHLGDLVDRRKYVSYRTAMAMRTKVLDPMAEYDCHLIVGNHDVTHKNTNEVNSLRELVMGRYDRVRIYSGPAEVDLGGLRTLLLPWICDENREVSEGVIRSTSAEWCMGHLELAGFKMYRDSPESAHGMSPRELDKFTGVLSGHFHHRSIKGNVCYVGAPYEMTWADAGDERGFHVLDTETGDLEYIRNPLTLHAKLHYEDGCGHPDPSLVEGKIVKVIVKSRADGLAFDSYMKRIEGSSPADVQVVDDHLHLDAITLEDMEEATEVEDTPSVLRRAIDSLDESVDKAALAALMLDVYAEAVNRR